MTFAGDVKLPQPGEDIYLKEKKIRGNLISQMDKMVYFMGIISRIEVLEKFRGNLISRMVVYTFFFL